MKFKSGSKRPVQVYEKDLIDYWKKNHIFERSVDERPADNSYVFYDGPPFITGVPHYGTLLSSIVKDAMPRYWTMKGKRVERVWGWDCHGLPAEVFTEKKLGIKDKRDVYKIGLEKYINTCRANMVQTGGEWEEIIDRIGRWVDFKGAYRTMDKDYMESVWWAFKKLYDEGKIYEGEKVLLYCTRDATPLSKAEVAMDNSYQDSVDPSVYVKFKLKNRDSYLLAWTTTPWTLLANTAVAVNPKLDYVEVEVGKQRFVLAKSLVKVALTDDKHKTIDYKLIREFKGKELVGEAYEPLFEAQKSDKAHKVYAADYVTVDEGTGVVHLAPAYGEEDYELAKKEGLPIVSNIDDNGFYKSGEWEGKLVWDCNKDIANKLYKDGSVWKISYVTHSYPHCYRCGTKLMYRAHPSWFMRIDSQRSQMLEVNSQINWFPEHFKEGRFEYIVKTAPDWNISRDRFWATAMPVWKGVDGKGKEHIKVVGSYAELKELSGKELEDYHRPWVDDITFKIDNVVYKRIDKVMDCWFESGSMPFAQFHYPFENQAKFEENFPGDFIAEYVGQVRAWFYYLHSISTGLFNKSAFKNVIVTGTVAGNDGRKMSKSFSNFTDPSELINLYSADALRFLLLSSPLLNGEDFSLKDKDVADVYRKLSMIWNMYDFFTLYASVDGWEWDGKLTDPSQGLSNPLDKWIVSRIHQLISDVDRDMQSYNIAQALKPVFDFIDDASNWYVRRSRKRFWKTENDTDKDNAYKTLHYILVKLSLVLAPFTPFLAEELYKQLTGQLSVHLCDWPESGHTNEILTSEMKVVRELVTQGLSIRATSGLKVRQPLGSASLVLPFEVTELDAEELKKIVAEELNIKDVSYKAGKDASIKLDLNITDGLRLEGLARELIRQVQNARKEANLNVDDRINLAIESGDKQIADSLRRYSEIIKHETLAKTINDQKSYSFKTKVKIEDRYVEIKLGKA
ncbi:MAG TPA: isoleucine--tRNA ligase [Candidatus Saccharimonadales bacterium]|nr:isoleucine--tRNA ligase [Candidatus Saccharimonadales bacterium]